MRPLRAPARRLPPGIAFSVSSGLPPAWIGVGTLDPLARPGRKDANIEKESRGTWTPTYLCTNRLPHHDRQCALEIASGAWLETFSGKEIFRHIRSQVPWKFPFENDEDLAYKLAEEWRRTKSTPQFIDTLRDAIIDGSGL